MACQMDILRTSLEAPSVGLNVVSLTEKRSQRSCLGCGGGHTPESLGTDGFEWPAENLAVQTEAQTDLAGNQRNCLYRS